MFLFFESFSAFLSSIGQFFGLNSWQITFFLQDLLVSDYFAFWGHFDAYWVLSGYFRGWGGVREDFRGLLIKNDNLKIMSRP